LIPELREQFNAHFTPAKYRSLLARTEAEASAPIQFRIAETPIFLSQALLDSISTAGIALTNRLLDWPQYLADAANSIPTGYRVAAESRHPNFLTADFALVRTPNGALAPRLVEMQAFPSVYAYQSMLTDQYAKAFNLPANLNTYLSGLDRDSFFNLLGQTILGTQAPENVVLTEVDPYNQKTLPDFLLTSAQFGIPIVDITHLIPVGNKLHYRNAQGSLVPVHRIYNRAIVDEVIARDIQLPFDLEAPWEVEWAGNPNWYFLISKFSVPFLCRPGDPGAEFVPPAVFLSDFLAGHGSQQLADSGVPLPSIVNPEAVYDDLLLKPLFSFAGKGIQFAPTQADLLAIPSADRAHYLLQQRMTFAPTIETPHGLTQAEIRILYLWPDFGRLTPALSLIRLGRGKMMGVDHNRNQEWVGASAAFWR